MNERRPGCLVGLLKLAALTWLYDQMQERFGHVAARRQEKMRWTG